MLTRRFLVHLIAAAAICAIAVGACSSSGSPSAAGASTGATASSAPATGLKVYYEDNAQVELIAPSGRRVLIDVWDPTALSAPVTANDILLTTHLHSDHYVQSFVDSFPGQKITDEEGQISLSDVSIVSIPAAHDSDLKIVPTGGSDYIFVLYFDGFRIAHFGDLGQDKINDDQLAKIGKVDIAFSQLSNSYSTMDAINQKGFDQMKQVKPLIFVPTHDSLDAATLAAKTWSATYSTKPMMVEHSQLPSDTTVVFMGSNAASYATILKLQPSSW